MNGSYLEYFKNWEEKIGAFLECRAEALQNADSASKNEGKTGHAAAPLLSGLPFAVKDNIAVKDFSLSCASRLLEGLRSPYTATAVQRLQEKGAFVIGKTNMDEFGMGSSTDLSALKKTNNPWNQELVSGGSSGGSAAAVAAGLVPFALGSDTGGSVRQPAAFCGVLGLKPTWGAVSRYGLVAYASSLETIGIISDTTERCRAVFNAIKGRDALDETTREPNANNGSGVGGVGGAKDGCPVIGVLSPESLAKALSKGGEAGKDALKAAQLSPAIERAFNKAKDDFLSLGYKLKELEFPALRFAVPAYYTIATAEASANLARFDSVRYGKRPEWAENPSDLVEKARRSGFGEEVCLRILLGTFVLRSGFQDKYYHRAQKIRELIRQNFQAELGNAVGSAGNEDRCAALLMPVFPTVAFGRGGSGLSAFEQKAADIWTCSANLAGLPALAFPVSVEDGLPDGVQIVGRPFSENALLDIVARYEAVHPFPHPPAYKNFWTGGA